MRECPVARTPEESRRKVKEAKAKIAAGNDCRGVWADVVVERLFEALCHPAQKAA